MHMYGEVCGNSNTHKENSTALQKGTEHTKRYSGGSDIVVYDVREAPILLFMKFPQTSPSMLTRNQNIPVKGKITERI